MPAIVWNKKKVSIKEKQVEKKQIQYEFCLNFYCQQPYV